MVKLHCKYFLRNTRGISLVLAFLLLFCSSSHAQMRRSEYLDYIRRAADEGWKEYPAVIERWRNSPKHHELWGYDAPGHPVYLADLGDL